MQFDTQHPSIYHIKVVTTVGVKVPSLLSIPYIMAMATAVSSRILWDNFDNLTKHLIMTQSDTSWVKDYFFSHTIRTNVDVF